MSDTPIDTPVVSSGSSPTPPPTPAVEPSYEYRILVKNGIYGIHRIITVEPGKTAITTNPVIPSGKNWPEFVRELKKYYAAALQPAVPYDSMVAPKKT